MQRHRSPGGAGARFGSFRSHRPHKFLPSSLRGAFSADSASWEMRDRGRRRAGTPPSGAEPPAGLLPLPPSSLFPAPAPPPAPASAPPPRAPSPERSPSEGPSPAPPSPATQPEHQPRGADPLQPASHQPSPARPPKSMNLFRFLGDLSHLLAIILLLLKIWKSRSCAGEMPTGAGEGGESAGDIPGLGEGFGGTKGTGLPTHSPHPLLAGYPPSRSGVTGGSVPFPRIGVHTLGWGWLRAPNSGPAGPSLLAPGFRGWEPGAVAGREVAGSW